MNEPHLILLRSTYMGTKMANFYGAPFVSKLFVKGMFTLGGGDSHMKQTGMLVVSLRGVNFGFWSRLGCFGQSANILSR